MSRDNGVTHAPEKLRATLRWPSPVDTAADAGFVHPGVRSVPRDIRAAPSGQGYYSPSGACWGATESVGRAAGDAAWSANRRRIASSSATVYDTCDA